MRAARATAILAALLTLAVLSGCHYRPSWPQEPAMVRGPANEPAAIQWRPEGVDGPGYLQTCRQGVVRGFYIDRDNDGLFEPLVDLDEIDPAELQYVFIFVDGVPFRLLNELYEQGHFRLFHRPTLMVSTFPSITDISFSTVFGIPGTSCYESLVYDRPTNKLHGPTSIYLSGENELWATRVDYRQRRWLDAYAYLLPRSSAHREFYRMFHRATRVLERQPDRRHVLIYAMSTDAMDHTGRWDQARAALLELERYIEELVYRRQGRLGLVMLSDHGNNFVADCRAAPLEQAVRRAGLTPIDDRGFRRDGEVLLPRYGLISLARAFCQSESDRERLISELLETEGVEHVMWRTGPAVRVAGNGGTAEINRRVEDTADGAVELFSYQTIEGDPLELRPILDTLQPRRFDEDPLEYYPAAELLTATAGHFWPDPLWRVWHGMTDHPAVVPDVVISLALGWYYGDPKLAFLNPINGTHGGLRDADSNAFFATNIFAPPAVMRTTDVLPLINAHVRWNPPTADPDSFGLHKYLTGPIIPGSIIPTSPMLWRGSTTRPTTRPTTPPAPATAWPTATAPAVQRPPLPMIERRAMSPVRPGTAVVAASPGWVPPPPTRLRPPWPWSSEGRPPEP